MICNIIVCIIVLVTSARISFAGTEMDGETFSSLFQANQLLSINTRDMGYGLNNRITLQF